MQEELGGQDGRCEKQKGAGAGEAARADAAGGERVARLSHGAAHVVGDVDGPTALAAHKWHAWYCSLLNFACLSRSRTQSRRTLSHHSAGYQLLANRIPS